MFSKLKKLFARCEHQYYFVSQRENTNTRKNQGKYHYNYKSNGGFFRTYQMHDDTFVVYKRCKKCNFKKEEAEFFGDGSTAEARNLAEELNKFVN